MAEVKQEIVDIIVANADKDDNTILGEIIGAGIPFTKAKGVMNQVLEEQGLRLNKEQRGDTAVKFLKGWKVSEKTTIDQVTEKLEALQEKLKCTVGQARGYIKSVFEEADLIMPKATKVKRKRTPGFHGDAKTTADWLIQNPEGTEADFVKFMGEEGFDKSKGGADKTKRFWNFVVELKTFANDWCEASNCR